MTFLSETVCGSSPTHSDHFLDGLWLLQPITHSITIDFSITYTTNEEETQMVSIKHHITIDGKDASAYSDEDILHIIKQLEDKAVSLSKMETQAKKKEQILQQIHDKIDELVKIIDNR